MNIFFFQKLKKIESKKVTIVLMFYILIGLCLHRPGLGLDKPGLGLDGPGLGLDGPGLGLDKPGLSSDKSGPV